MGTSSTQIGRLLRDGHWERRLPRVCAHRAAPRTRHQAVLAAGLAPGRGALVSSITGLEVWDLDGRAARLHLLVSAENRRRNPEIVVHRSFTLHPADVDKVRGIPVTSVPGTLADVAGILPVDRAGWAGG